MQMISAFCGLFNIKTTVLNGDFFSGVIPEGPLDKWRFFSGVIPKGPLKMSGNL